MAVSVPLLSRAGGGLDASLAPVLERLLGFGGMDTHTSDPPGARAGGRADRAGCCEGQRGGGGRSLRQWVSTVSSPLLRLVHASPGHRNNLAGLWAPFLACPPGHPTHCSQSDAAKMSNSVSSLLNTFQWRPLPQDQNPATSVHLPPALSDTALAQSPGSS